MVCEFSQGIYFFMFLVFDTQKSGKCKIIYRFSVKYLAEREGFEPSVRLPVQRFSRPSRSTTPASFLKPSAKLRLFSEKHHFYPIFFNQKVGQAEKRARFTLSTNHQQIVIRQTLFPSPTFQVARFRINTSRTFGGSSCKKRTASFRCGPPCYVKLIIISLCRRLCRCLRGSNPVQRTCRPRRCPERRCGLR